MSQGLWRASLSPGGGRLAFPVILSRRGEVLHNHMYDNLLRDGDLVVHDSGASAPSGYASDITRTIPVSGTFSQCQRAVYECVLRAQMKAIAAVRPGALFRDLHFLAAEAVTRGLVDLGLMQGDVEDAVAAGAHALFFPHGLGHMMGLDVHDMEGLGEDLVGYDARTTRPDAVRRAIPAHGQGPGARPCIDGGAGLLLYWSAHRPVGGRTTLRAVYQLSGPRGTWRDFGGVRIEDDVLVTASGCRILGRPIPKTVREVEEASAR